ncbi:MAG TPA: ferritin-like domain-containing protein [Rhizomicrobium sp.]|jgi:rubrerythrin
MSTKPAYMPESAGDAFKHINAVTAPTIDDLKLMVYLEASGQVGYGELAASAPNEAISKLLAANGREEIAHAHRVAKAIKLLSGEDFPVPEPADNPYARPSGRKCDRAILEYLVSAEFFGDTLYQTWADNTGNAEAAALLRQNGVEETKHGKRAQEALGLMDA